MVAADNEVPSILWHYTSLETLIKIVSNKSIRASEAHYLNDATEFEYGRQVAKKATEARFPPGSSVLEWMNGFLSRFSLERKTRDVFVFSTSERGDLLSQWRSYCPPGAGCSIGFDSDALSHAVELQPIQCVYTEHEQMALIDSIIEQGLEAGRGPHPSSAGSHVGFLLEGVIPRFKHSSFQEECEWRLIQKRDRDYPRGDEKPIEYRMGKSMIVPYLELSLRPLPIAEIKLGPCPHPELSRKAVESLLATHKLTVPVTHSEIPYRAW